MYQKLICTAAVAGENIISNLGQMSDLFPSISPSFSSSARAIFKVLSHARSNSGVGKNSLV